MEQYEVFLYCPKCSQPFSSSSPNVQICTECGLQFYMSPKPAACCIILTPDGKIIATRRNKNPYRGQPDLPGGFVDAGETFEEAVIREIHEELGFTITREQISYFSSTYGTYPYQDIVYSVLVTFFIVQLKVMPDITKFDPVEVQEVLLYHPNEVNILDFGMDTDRKVLEDYLKNRR